MFSCKKVGANTYYIESPVNMGLYIENGEAWLIDSGVDAKVGKKIQKILQENNWTLKAILNTHSHADHIGGNRYLQEAYNCPVYANGLDCVFIENTYLSPMALWGAFPPKPLQNKLIMAENSKAQDIQTAPLPQGFEIIPLYGHGLYMIAIRTPDNIVFMADELLSPFILEKYGVPFNYHVASYVESLEKAKEIKAELYIPSHGEPTQNILPLIETNLKTVLELREFIYTLCEKPILFDYIIQAIFNRFALPLSFVQYAVVGSSIRSYIAWLYDENLIEPITKDNVLYWQQKK